MTDAAHTLPGFVNGAPARSDRVIERENPAHPAEIVGRVAAGDADGTAAAIEAAERAFPRWVDAGPDARASALRSAADTIRAHATDDGSLLARELGKARPDSIGEANFSAVYLDQAVDEAYRVDPVHTEVSDLVRSLMSDAATMDWTEA